MRSLPLVLVLVLVAAVGCGDDGSTNAGGCPDAGADAALFYYGDNCSPGCSGGNGLCRTSSGAPYCADLTRDLANCGDCGNACTCTTAGTSPRCTSGRCSCSP